MQDRIMPSLVTGSEALGRGACEAGVRYVTGYPGSPATATVEALLRLTDSVRIEWAINEKSAFDAALGASLAGTPSLVCLKSVGLNVALDSLMVGNLAAGDGGLVILVGDDPGGWGSQNEQDSRLLAVAAEVPLLEPTSVADCQSLMVLAFSLSQEFRVPVVVRVTRALTEDRVALAPHLRSRDYPGPVHFDRGADRHNVLPIHVVAYHRRLQASLEKARQLFEASPKNAEVGDGRVGLVTAGYAYQKAATVLDRCGQPPVRILRLATLMPLPEQLIGAFLGKMNRVLVLEETSTYLEVHTQAIAQRAGLTLPIFGRRSGHIPGAGELSEPDIAAALGALLPDWRWPQLPNEDRPMPSREPFCDGCPYPATFAALLEVMERHGGRDAYVVSGETGCMVRAQQPPFQLLDLKFGMGSSIGLAAGLARSGTPQRIIALSGDSALLHSGFGELVDAVQAGIRLLVLVLANQTTALSGGQPHPATAQDARGRSRRPIDLAELVRAAGADKVRMLGPEDSSATLATLDEAVATCWDPTSDAQVVVVIVDRACPRSSAGAQ